MPAFQGEACWCETKKISDNRITKKYSVTADNYEVWFRIDSTQRAANHHRVPDSQRRFLAQSSITTLLRHCFEWLQHCSNIAALCCAQNRRCESSLVTSPLTSPVTTGSEI